MVGRVRVKVTGPHAEPPTQPPRPARPFFSCFFLRISKNQSKGVSEHSETMRAERRAARRVERLILGTDEGATRRRIGPDRRLWFSGRRPLVADANIFHSGERRGRRRRGGGGRSGGVGGMGGWTSQSISHETTAMAIKGAITSPREQTRFRLLPVRPAVAVAAERRLRASGCDSRLGFRTHTHITGRRRSYFSTVSHFCLLAFREGERGDVQTQHTHSRLFFFFANKKKMIKRDSWAEKAKKIKFKKRIFFFSKVNLQKWFHHNFNCVKTKMHK